MDPFPYGLGLPKQAAVVDPVELIKLLWPDITLYDKQREILYSLCDDDETIVPAGNMLGKDFIAGLAVLWFFLTRHPCRIITTSVDSTQLESVLWGEIRRFIHSSKYPLTKDNGGPLLVNHLHLRKIHKGNICGLSYVLGRVAGAEGEGMLGHHIAKTGDNIPRTLAVGDEASGLPDIYKDKFDTWADRQLYIGNCYPCENFFKRAVQGLPGSEDRGGDIPRDNGKGFYRKVIRITAEDSPNVKYGLMQESKGIEPTNEMLLPGVKSYADYKRNRRLWDPVKQCISLDAMFYEGSEAKMYPGPWLIAAERRANELQGVNRKAVSIGVDSAMGGDNTAWAICDELGLIDLISMKTKDTTVIVNRTMALKTQYGVLAENILFDAGGGGYQHACTLRERGLNVRTVGFGEAASPELKRRIVSPLAQRVEEKETRYVYANRRAEMYGMLRLLLDPSLNPKGFGIPARFTELKRQLAPLPLLFDKEGRFRMLPKNRPSLSGNKKTSEPTLLELLGCSPDESDALVLAVFGLEYRRKPAFAGRAF